MKSILLVIGFSFISTALAQATVQKQAQGVPTVAVAPTSLAGVEQRLDMLSADIKGFDANLSQSIPTLTLPAP
jgi:hypothetical protein